MGYSHLQCLLVLADIQIKNCLLFDNSRFCYVLSRNVVIVFTGVEWKACLCFLTFSKSLKKGFMLLVSIICVEIRICWSVGVSTFAVFCKFKKDWIGYDKHLNDWLAISLTPLWSLSQCQRNMTFHKHSWKSQKMFIWLQKTPGYWTANLATSFEKLDLKLPKTCYQWAAMHVMNEVVKETKVCH